MFISPFSSKSDKLVINQKQWPTAIFGLLALLIGIKLYFNPENLPGDLGDSRINQYVLAACRIIPQDKSTKIAA